MNMTWKILIFYLLVMNCLAVWRFASIEKLLKQCLTAQQYIDHLNHGDITEKPK